MNAKKLALLFFLLFTKILCNGQGLDFQKNIEILNADYGNCYTVKNYMLCPEHKQIREGKMFGTQTRDCFGYFPDSTLRYDDVTMIIFAGDVFFDNSGLNIDWKTVELLSYRDHYAEFTEGKIIYRFSYGNIQASGSKYDKDTYVPHMEKRLEFRKEDELTEGFYVKNNIFYFKNSPILEPFDVANLHTIISKTGFESNYITDGTQVIFGGGKTGTSNITKDGINYVLVKKWIIEGVDLPSVRVLGRDLLVDKNALYYQENAIPFDKLNKLKILIREL